MADPFSQCESVNLKGFRCYLARGHRYGIHETHPAEGGKSRDAGASPVWSDATAGRPTPCRFCGAPIDKPAEGRWHSTDVRDDSPWTCPSNTAGHWPNWLSPPQGYEGAQ
jgi:hypothetical protein